MQPPSNATVPDRTIHPVDRTATRCDDHRSPLCAWAALSELDGIAFDALLSSVDHRIWWKNTEGEIMGCNQAFAEGFGFESARDLIGLTDHDLPLPSELAHKFELDDQRVMRTKVPVRNAQTWLDQGSSSGHVQFSLVPLTDDDDTVIGLLGISTDISDRVEIEQQLAAERDVLDKILSNIPYQIAWQDRRHRFLGANPAFKALVGLHPNDQITGLAANDLPGVVPDWLETLTAGNEAVMGPGGTEAHELVTVETDEGRTRHLDISRVPLTDAGGIVTGLLLMFRDITERQTLEARLADGSKMEAIGQLASGVAHEINTPIQFVGDNLSFLKSVTHDLTRLLFTAVDVAETVVNEAVVTDAESTAKAKAEALIAACEQADLNFLNDEVPRAVDQSREGVERVSRIVRALKEFAHPGGEEPEPTQVNDVITSTISVASNEWKYVAEVELALDPDLPQACCRPGKIGQVILILVVNAAQAIAERAGTDRLGRITVTTRATEDAIEISVSDTGGGIADDVLPHIFEPFFTTKEVGKGSGQGLSLAHRIVTRDHGGTLTVDTDTDEGTTTFTITIPKEVAPDDRQPT